MNKMLDRDVTVRATPAAEGVLFEFGTATACAVREVPPVPSISTFLPVKD